MKLEAVRIPPRLRAFAVQGTEAFDVSIDGGVVKMISPSTQPARGTLLSGLVDAHAHIDKNYTVREVGAAEGDLFAAIGRMAAHRAGWTADALRARMTRALDDAWRAGTRALRTHLDWGEASAPVSLAVFEELREATGLRCTAALSDLAACNVFIVTVPTPIDEHKRPDLTPLIKASTTIGTVLKPGDVVIYESTVYPGATEEDCVPVLEKTSGLEFNVDFYAGYSPERINPGDKEHRVSTIKKVTSGSTPEVAELVDALYREIIVVGTHKAESIRVAEAAKVIENTQRDVNIALINELAIIFNRMGIDTEAVLQAAGSKWNFLPFRPGLVGGHCIGVDPYYLTHKAQAIGYHPEIILAGRRLNDGMGAYVVSQLVKAMLKRRITVEGARVLVMGLTFKENCPDLRNTRIVDIVKELGDYNIQADVYDPWVDVAEAQHEYGLTPIDAPQPGTYDAIIVGVAHEQFKAMGADAIRALGKPEHVVYDLKYVMPRNAADLRL